jgi:3-oxoacyl-[acyl-carrier protein] reductase
MTSLNGKVALVTGGARGIGKAIVQTLSDSGAAVAFTYKSSSTAAAEITGQLQQKGRRVFPYQSDAASFSECGEVVENVLKEAGRLDILVNNAGITRDGLLMRMSEGDWDTVIANNLKSVFNFSKAACRSMMSQRSGKIICISSIAGVVGNPGQTNYASSKAGMIGFTKSLAKELGSRNIQVNAIAPGFVDTDMTEKLSTDQKRALVELVPLKRTGQAHEIAAAVRFLASSESDYITGQVICVDGGMTM